MLKVSIKSRVKSLFDGSATSVTSKNTTGEFDVLGSHANFVTLIKEKLILDKGLSTEKKFDVNSGILSCNSDVVVVYLDL